MSTPTPSRWNELYGRADEYMDHSDDEDDTDEGDEEEEDEDMTMAD